MGDPEPSTSERFKSLLDRSLQSAEAGEATGLKSITKYIEELRCRLDVVLKVLPERKIMSLIETGRAPLNFDELQDLYRLYENKAIERITEIINAIYPSVIRYKGLRYRIGGAIQQIKELIPLGEARQAVEEVTATLKESPLPPNADQILKKALDSALRLTRFAAPLSDPGAMQLAFDQMTRRFEIGKGPQATSANLRLVIQGEYGYSLPNIIEKVEGKLFKLPTEKIIAHFSSENKRDDLVFEFTKALAEISGLIGHRIADVENPHPNYKEAARHWFKREQEIYDWLGYAKDDARRQDDPYQENTITELLKRFLQGAPIEGVEKKELTPAIIKEMVLLIISRDTLQEHQTSAPDVVQDIGR